MYKRLLKFPFVDKMVAVIIAIEYKLDLQLAPVELINVISIEHCQ